MLERIEEIKGIGLLNNVDGKKHKLHKATLIYSDNGRGKSTLASILRSVSTGEIQLLTDRKTVDSSLAPTVIFQFGSGHKVSFTNGSWSETRPELLIFDLDFIEKNVHSGGAVSSGHRKNLLEFALGAAAVSARKLEMQTTEESTKANALVTQLTAQLAGYHQGLALSVFEKLKSVPDADSQIAAIKKRITTSGNITSILAKPIPAVGQEPVFDLDALFLILEKSLDGIQDDAEKLVRCHINSINKEGTEAWLSSGQNYDDSVHCPYCGQDTSSTNLIQAYRSHFNAAYNDLKKQVAILERGVTLRTNPTILETFAAAVTTANKMASSWETEITTDPVNFDIKNTDLHLTELRELLLSLVVKKQINPTVSAINSIEKIKVQKLWNLVHTSITDANQKIQTNKLKIEEFRKTLTNENSMLLQAQISQIEASKKRFDVEVVALFGKLASAKLNATESEAKKKKAREELEKLMSAVLGKFQKSINSLLQKFGASFKIEKMDTNFRGGAPRSEYGISLRGKSVPLEGGPPKFTTALSEGDKRTLALAFFVSTALDDPEISKKIIVIDDPMCSLDVNRKHHTKTVLKQLYESSEQLIVLAHDPYFIRAIRDDLIPKDGQTQTCTLQLRHSSNGYSDLDKFDVDQECESSYFRHHRLILEFFSSSTHDPRDVAKAIRPFLEGYLHRRFPSFIRRDQMFGQVLSFIKDSASTSPVAFAQPLVTDLQEINDYAGQFHHDTNPGNFDKVQVVSSELKSFCERALHIVHSGTKLT